MIGDVANNLEAMSPPQYVLAFTFLGSYPLALGRFISARGRCFAIAMAAAAATGFAALSDPWEYGVMVVALALAGMGLFVAAAWTMWTLASWRDAYQQRPRHEPEPAPAPRPTRAVRPQRHAVRARQGS